jgi:beta-glucosidase
MHVSVGGTHDDGDLTITVACRVTNTGQRAGKEVVQVYVRDVEPSVARPVRELKAFTKVSLQPGEATTVTVELGSRDLSYWSVRAHDWLLEAGEFEIAVGASSRDLRLSARVNIAASPFREPLGPMSTLVEWLADPNGSTALRRALGTDESGRPKGFIGDEELIRVIGNFPMSTLATFPGTGVDDAVLDAIIEEIRSGD